MRIAVLDDYQGAARESADWQRLEPRHDIQFLREHIADPHELVRRLAGHEVIVAMRERTPLGADVLGALPHLRLLVTTGMRNASIDLVAAKRLGITVSGTSSLPYPTAELAWAHVLCLARRLPMEDRALRDGQWQTSIGVGLNGKTLGVVGLGTLGSRIAGYGLAFGMRVLAWSQNPSDERAAAVGATRVTFDELLERSNFISIHLVLSERTRGLFSAQKIARMKRTAYLVNTSRGPIIDEAALADALTHQRIAGAGIDVYPEEPLPPGSAIRAAPRTVLTPHLGYVTVETYQVFYGDAVENIEAFERGAPGRVLNG
ncbi:MAG: D-2-hydroxyacid dehydrogenase family protein [Pseudomonadota bacterium]|nr:D-2-hydroxyacid dehydrogenase family protein [Pseudomonadota bacterium]